MDEWRCRRHPPLAGGGVCPHCLRDRLLRLCPDCAKARPCACSSSASSLSSSSSPGAASALGRVHSLIERDRRVTRSRSVAAAPHGGTGTGGGGAIVGDHQQRRANKSGGVFGWVSFRKPPPPPPPQGCRDVEQEYDDAVALARSRSVSATTTATATAAAPSSERKGAAPRWGKFIPGKIKALRSRKHRGAGGDWRDSVR